MTVLIKIDRNNLVCSTKFKRCTIVTKRVTRCRFGHPELLIPTESATKGLEVDISFKTLHHGKVKLRSLKLRWQYQQRGHFQKMELKGFSLIQSKQAFVIHFYCYRSKWAVSRKKIIEQTPYNVNKSDIIIIIDKMTPRRYFLVIS